jgi:SAM-dependent methyltransferase
MSSVASKANNRVRDPLNIKYVDGSVAVISPDWTVVPLSRAGGQNPGRSPVRELPNAVRHVAKLATRGFVAGIDPSEVMLRQASRRNRDYIRNKRVELKLASMSAIPYPDSCFDKVFGTNSIQFTRDLLSDLREICRVLRPGGWPPSRYSLCGKVQPMPPRRKSGRILEMA